MTEEPTMTEKPTMTERLTMTERPTIKSFNTFHNKPIPYRDYYEFYYTIDWT